jgi:hypothetical protein
MPADQPVTLSVGTTVSDCAQHKPAQQSCHNQGLKASSSGPWKTQQFPTVSSSKHPNAASSFFSPVVPVNSLGRPGRGTTPAPTSWTTQAKQPARSPPPQNPTSSHRIQQPNVAAYSLLVAAPKHQKPHIKQSLHNVKAITCAHTASNGYVCFQQVVLGCDGP